MQRFDENNMVLEAADDVMTKYLGSELCSDLLGDIMGRLCVTDQARFHAVCKSWRNVHPSSKFCKSWRLKSTSILSWFVRLDRTSRQPSSTLVFRLYEPCHSIYHPVSIHTISLTELCIPVPSFWLDIRIFCKYSWLFISVVEEKSSTPDQIYFVLFSPLTKTLKQLPPCLVSRDSYLEQSISSDPESADCVFLLLDTNTFSDWLTISTYRNDDKEWTVRRLRKPLDYKVRRWMPMYDWGIFYLVSPFGPLAIYDVNNKKIKFECLSLDDELAANYDKVKSRYKLFTVNGELMFSFGPKANTSTKKYDETFKMWVHVNRDNSASVKKPHSVEYMIEFFCSGCLICSSQSFNMDQLMRQVPKFVFDPGCRKRQGLPAGQVQKSHYS